MIYNDRFVWLHFPKCAGTKVEKIFETFFHDEEGLVLDPVGTDKDPSIGWHDSIEERNQKVQGFAAKKRDVIIPVRRLAPWLVSRFCFELQRSPNLPHDMTTLLRARFLEASGFENHADYYMEKYVPEYLLENSNVRFLRVEFFEEDFKDIFSDYLDVSKVPSEIYKSKVNLSDRVLPPEFIGKLNATDFSEVAPWWTEVQRMAYSGF